MPITLDGTLGVTTPMYNGSITANAVTPSVNMKNRIINGAMVIDQRNAGASVTSTTSNPYTLDRWQSIASVSSKFTIQQNAGSVTPPAGFRNYLGVTSSAATTVGSADYYLIQQKIEGFNMADLNWGTANAQTVTLSFWVRSSLTGTFGGSFGNNAFDRTYPFTYTISAANTWEQKTITVAGDTTGTWLTTNGVGIQLTFGLGSGSTFSGPAGAWASAGYQTATGATQVVATNGATFYITGVQLEVGSTATSFDYRPYGTEFQLCMRYYYKLIMNEFGAINGFVDNSTNAICYYQFPVPMRSSPTLGTTGTATNYGIRQPTTGLVTCNAVPAIIGTASVGVARIQAVTAGSLTTNSGCGLAPDGASAFLSFSAEL